MPTAKRRINITLDDQTDEALERLSEERNQPGRREPQLDRASAGIPGRRVLLPNR
jgi:hypothetical protein